MVLRNIERYLTRERKMDELVDILAQHKLKISAAESCTGGLFMSMMMWLISAAN